MSSTSSSKSIAKGANPKSKPSLRKKGGAALVAMGEASPKRKAASKDVPASGKLQKSAQKQNVVGVIDTSVKSVRTGQRQTSNASKPSDVLTSNASQPTATTPKGIRSPSNAEMIGEVWVSNADQP